MSDASRPTRETPPPATNGSDVYVPVHRKVDLENYHPDDIAAALLERVFMLISRYTTLRVRAISSETRDAP